MAALHPSACQVGECRVELGRILVQQGVAPPWDRIACRQRPHALGIQKEERISSRLAKVILQQQASVMMQIMSLMIGPMLWASGNTFLITFLKSYCAVSQMS